MGQRRRESGLLLLDELATAADLSNLSIDDEEEQQQQQQEEEGHSVSAGSGSSEEAKADQEDDDGRCIFAATLRSLDSL